MVVQKPIPKAYYQFQITAISPTLDKLVPKGHAVRALSNIVNRIHILYLLDAYRMLAVIFKDQFTIYTKDRG